MIQAINLFSFIIYIKMNTQKLLTGKIQELAAFLINICNDEECKKQISEK